MIKLYNEDCFETISRLNITKKPVDLILTSPPYNTGKYSTSHYVPRGTDILVYDPFMCTGTTAVGCVKYGVSCIDSELSEGQTEFAKQRLEELCIDR